jgi:hypothetical protein
LFLEWFLRLSGGVTSSKSGSQSVDYCAPEIRGRLLVMRDALVLKGLPREYVGTRRRTVGRNDQLQYLPMDVPR